MRRRLTLLVLSSFLFPSFVYGETEIPDSPGYFQVMPRFWYGSTPAESSTYSVGTGTITEKVSAEGEPKYGASFVWGPANSSADYVLTFFYGQTEVTNSALFVPFADLPPVVGAVTWDQTNVDVELLRRSRLSPGALFLPSSFSSQLVYGIRYLYHNEDDVRFSEAFGAGSPDASYSLHNVFAEAGVSTSYALDHNRRHNLVMHGTVGMGIGLSEFKGSDVPAAAEEGKSFSLRWEVAGGYQWQFAERWGILARYRALFGYYTDDQGPVLLDSEVKIVHGPELGIAYTF